MKEELWPLLNMNPIDWNWMTEFLIYEKILGLSFLHLGRVKSSSGASEVIPFCSHQASLGSWDIHCYVCPFDRWLMYK